MRLIPAMAVLATLISLVGQGVHAEQHRVYAKKMLVMKNCSPSPLSVTAVHSTHLEQSGRKHRTVAQFETFQFSDTPVEEVHVKLDGDEKVYRDVEAGNYTLHAITSPKTGKWKFIKRTGTSC
ncbi:MAG: hypothetical protein VYC38_07445 [Pseudomonadota bacterium]|nr:hypothetical protein [Pseudomonadota bacterium]